MTEYTNKFVAQSQDKGHWTLDSGLWTKILHQMARELLLAQSSDWAFQIYQGTTVEYSTRRFQSHIQRFDLLCKMLDSGSVDHELLTEIEARDNIFPEIDFRIYQSKNETS